MSFVNSFKKIASVGLRIYKCNRGLKSASTGAALDALKHKDISFFIQPLNSLSICKSQTEKCHFNFPQIDRAFKKNITEPDNFLKVSFELPIRSSVETALDLPLHIEKEIKDPPLDSVISKRATHMIIIRRRKMRRHKYKKHLKKFKIEIAEKKLKKRLRKENDLKLSINDIFKEVETFNPEKYVDEMLEKSHWQKPVTRVKGYLAPKWVVDQHLKEKEENRIMWERVNKCIK